MINININADIVRSLAENQVSSEAVELINQASDEQITERINDLVDIEQILYQFDTAVRDLFEEFEHKAHENQ